ncbi:nucleotidyltransferase family protein [uncultured Mucilaginibacter sp.]|uniref:nucleotidyltransferase family protein n=1 Tax=uncultured Mucilaginibacter sp. TaxID=797541 RepID=UPI0025E91021|nr:nucleotidyltransferase family protein [uncultured Mucilaginibacter sp.]
MTGIIILAAGSSTRMGRPKQQLPYNNGTLLQNAINAALGVESAGVYVVLGSHADEITDELSNLPVNILYNHDWQLGMASSINTGVEALSANKDVGSALIMLCDQPFADASLLNNLIQLKPDAAKYIVACGYADSIGVPAIFSRSYFNSLLSLTGEQGAKKLIADHSNEVIVQNFEKGKVDIDTPVDYEMLKHGQFNC